MSSVASPEHLSKSRALRILLASYARSEDLIRIGAYQKGFDVVLDRAVEVLPALEKFLQQSSHDSPSFVATAQQLRDLPS